MITIDAGHLNKKLTEKKANFGELFVRLKNAKMSGWVDLPEKFDKELLEKIKKTAKKIQEESEYLVCIGIGGSYLGHRAIIEALNLQNSAKSEKKTKILYAGESISPRDLKNVLIELGNSDFSVNMISKSGTTLEPAVAFRFFKQKLVEKYGEEGAKSRIYATTDAKKGILHEETKQNGYASFIVPDDIGGRYSVLTPVGLLPLAVAGADIDALLEGAKQETARTLENEGGEALKFAEIRYNIHKSGKNIEIFSSFEPSFRYFFEWWKQLFAESEGKDGKGLYPAYSIFSTDLHSVGQYIQDGSRDIFETFLTFKEKSENYEDLKIPESTLGDDGMRFLDNRSMLDVNDRTLEATIEAHVSSGIPILKLEIPDISDKSLGSLIQFSFFACVFDSFLLGVDPFDQPGVEVYKSNMLRLLKSQTP